MEARSLGLRHRGYAGRGVGDADQQGWRGHTSTLDGYEKFLVDESHKYIDFIPAEHVSKNLYFPEEKAQRIAQIEAELQTYVKQNAALFITGQKDLDAEWAAYVDGFGDSG